MAGGKQVSEDADWWLIIPDDSYNFTEDVLILGTRTRVLRILFYVEQVL